MKISLQLEELAQFVASIIILVYLDVDIAWWLWPILFLAPDIGMIGYVVNPLVGSWTYNLFHMKSIALIITAFGFFTNNLAVLVSGVVLFGHSAMDRTMGYGLKYVHDFKHTHLGNLK
ncbi:MAG: DUF4260 domain-containing protein [Bacteroidota bacterium]